MKLMNSLIALTCLSVFASCGTPKIPVKERWGESVRNFALVPIYPMRENVFIGDVRIHTSEGDPYSLTSRYLGHIEVEAALENLERSLPVYGSSNSKPKPTSEKPAWQQPTSNLSAGNAADRLRLAALPKIDLTRLTGGDLGGSGVIGIWNFLIGGSAESEQTLVMSVSGVENLELPDPIAIGAFNDYLQLQFGKDSPELSAICSAARRFEDPKFEHTRISMVTRVVYARGIDYAFGDNFGAAVRAAAGEGTVNTGALTAQDDGNDQTPPTIDLTQLSATGVPGLSASFRRQTKDGLSITEVFERPMAFGVDLITIDPTAYRKDLVNLCSGDTISSSVQAGPAGPGTILGGGVD